MVPLMFYDWTYIFIIPGLLLGLYAQWKVRSAYRHLSGRTSRAGRPAWEVAAAMLADNGNNKVSIGQVSGLLTDHYDPKKESIALSRNVYNSASLAALGIAAHEAGHAMQKFTGYGPMVFRNAFVPVVNIGSRAFFPLFLLGMVFSWEPLIMAGIVCFALSLLFSLVTLPVEFNASRLGICMLAEGGHIREDEKKEARRVLNAAALTYVAAAITSLLQMIRLMVLSGSRRRR